MEINFLTGRLEVLFGIKESLKLNKKLIKKFIELSKFAINNNTDGITKTKIRALNDFVI